MSGLEITMIRRGDSLVPSAQWFLDLLHNIPDGKEVFVTIRRVRSVQHHRFFFGALHEIVESGQWEGDVDTLLIYLKIGIGYVTTVIGETGKVFYVPKSIAFESMSEDQFQEFRKKADAFFVGKMKIDIEEIYRRISSKMAVDDSGEARDGKGHVIQDEAAPITQPLGPDVSSEPSSGFPQAAEPLGARLKRLADALHVDTPEELQRVRDEMRASEEALALYREAPKQTKAIVQLSEQFAGQLFTQREYDEVLQKIIASAG